MHDKLHLAHPQMRGSAVPGQEPEQGRLQRASGSPGSGGSYRQERRRQLYVRRRRALLWTPLASVGAVLLVWQVTSDVPVPLFVYIGIALCLPWVADV